MSKALEKAAEFSNPQLFLLSLLAGGAGFGGMRLLNDLHNNVAPMTPPDNSIKLELPNPHKHQHQVGSTQDLGMASPEPSMGGVPALNKAADFATPPTASNVFMPYIAMGGGLPLGFLGAKSLYDKYQGNQLDQQINKAREDYHKQLLLAQSMQKGAEETPNVDKLCEAMAEEYEKTAGVNWKGLAAGTGIAASVGAADYGLHNLSPTQLNANPPVLPGLSEKQVTSWTPKDPDSLASANDAVRSNGVKGLHQIANKVTGGTLGAGEDLWWAGAGLSAAGLLGLLIHNHNKKKEREMKGNYPTNIEYAG